METYRELIMALAKVIIAVAWADHELNEEELESLKDVVFRLNSSFDMGSQLSGQEQAELRMYLEAPVDEAERDLLVKQLQERIRNADEKAQALAALENLVNADGEVSEEEEAALAEVSASIEQVGTGIGRLGWVVSKSVNRRSKKAQATVRLGESEISADGDLDMPAEDLRRLVLAAGLMARVAYIDRDVLDNEVQLMHDVMEAYWKASPEAAKFVAQVAVSEAAAEADDVRLLRGFTEVYSHDERVQFLDVLFGIAKADGEISRAERDEIEGISRSLGIINKYFVIARSKFD